MYVCIYIYIYIYVCMYVCMYVYVDIHTYTHPVSATRSYTYTRAQPRMRVGRKGGAHIGQVGDTRGVPHADVRVERRRRVERLASRATRGPRRQHALACVGAVAWAPNRTRTHARARAQTQHVRARVRLRNTRACAAGPHRRSVRPCS